MTRALISAKKKLCPAFGNHEATVEEQTRKKRGVLSQAESYRLDPRRA